MKTILMVVGKTTDKPFAAAIQEYVTRISHYLSFNIETIPELKGTKSLSESEQKECEAKLIRKALQPGDYIVLLDEFAQWLQKKMSAGPRRLVFVVGGPYGFAPSIHQLAAEEISLSQMTLSHQMIRLLFTEQMYRALTILNGEPYHHE